MKYAPKTTKVEAAAVDLAGRGYVAVVVDDMAQLIDAAVFHMFFAPVENGAIPQKENGHRAIPRKPTPCKAGKPPGLKISGVMQQVLDVLQSHGPLTSAELRDHVYPGLDKRKQVSNFSAASLAMARKGLIARRECPETRLDKWWLVKAANGGTHG